MSYFPGARLITYVGLPLALLFICIGCAPAPQLHGRAAFDAWIAENVTVIHQPLDPHLPAAYYDVKARTVYYDDARVPVEYAGAGPWLDVHEKAHAVALAAGLWIGGETCTADPYYCPPAERAAQCVTAVVLPDAVNPWKSGAALGYWTCPAELVDKARLAMTSQGAW